MKLSDRFAKPAPYIAWLLVSALLLAITSSIDSNVLAITAYGTAGVSIVLISASLMVGMRPFLWALLAALPTLVVFSSLSIFR
jgi:hypothetical protein